MDGVETVRLLVALRVDEGEEIHCVHAHEEGGDRLAGEDVHGFEDEGISHTLYLIGYPIQRKGRNIKCSS